MKTQPVEKRFFFLANAVALAGHVRSPNDFFIPAVASSCLPVTGGVGQVTVDNLTFGDVLSCGSAWTSVSGTFATDNSRGSSTEVDPEQDDLPTVSSAESRAGTLRLTNGKRVLEIELLEAKLGSTSERRGVTEFHTLSAIFQNVRFDGVLLNVITHCDLFEQYSTKQKLEEAYATSPSLRERLAPCFFSGEPVNPSEHGIPDEDGIIYGTIVSKLEWQGKPPEGAVIQGNSVIIEGFGTIYFGEILIEEGFRRLTLLRFKLKDSTTADGSIVECQTNGSTWPPRK